MTQEEEKLTERLKELVPIDLLTEEQRMKMMSMDRLEAIKYFNSVTNEGLKMGSAYYDLYVNVLPEKYVKGLSAYVMDNEGGWYTIAITYNGETIKIIRPR